MPLAPLRNAPTNPCGRLPPTRGVAGAAIPPTARLMNGARERLGVEVAGGEVIVHLLVSGLYKPRVVENVLDLVGGGVAADVPFLHHVPEVRPMADAVADVLEDLPLLLGAVPVAKEHPQERSLFLSHTSSFHSSRVCPCPLYATTVSGDSKK